MSTDRATRTRESLLEAGVTALAELRTPELITAIGTREVARRAGVSVATLFHHFDSVEGFAQALIQRIYDPLRPSASRAGIARSMTRVQAATLASEASLEFYRGQYDRLVRDDEHRLRIGLWALGGPESRAAYGDYMRVRDDLLATIVAGLHDSWGRELRPPVDLPSYVATQAALLTGAVVRGTSDPSAMASGTFSRSAAALNMVLLRAQGEPRTLDDRLVEMNYYRPARADSRDGAASSRAAILTAAESLFDEHGFAGTTVARLARAAGVSTSTLYDCFEDKSAIAVALLLEHGHSELAEAPDDADLEQRLEQVARVLAARMVCLPSYAQALACGDLPDDPLVAYVGAVAPDWAALLVLGLARSLLLHPASGPEGVVAAVLALWGGDPSSRT